MLELAKKAKFKLVGGICAGMFLLLMISDIAFAEGGGFEFGFALGGGPAVSRIDEKFTSSASGTSTMLIGGQFGNGTHLDLLMESAEVQPLRGGSSQEMMPKGYLVNFGFTGLRLGHRWGRWHIWGDAAIGSLYESGDFEPDYNRDSVGHTMFGGGFGYEFAKWDSTSIEIYASGKQINRADSGEFAVRSGRNIAAQNYGIALNFYPALWNSSLGSSSYSSSPTYIYCFDCGFQLMRVMIEVGAALPQIGMALTQVAFSAMK